MESPEYHTPKTIPESVYPIKRHKVVETLPVRTDEVIIDIGPEVVEPENSIKLRDDDTLKATHNRLAIEEHATLFKLYDDMTSVKYISKKTPEEINLLNDEFKEKLQNFKANYDSEESYKKSIKMFEDGIEQGSQREHTLKLFDEPTNFNNEITMKTRADLNIITNITMISQTSSSSSYIFKAKFSNKPCFIKAFFIPEKNLLYEQKIYRYIQTRDEKIKPYYEDYFIKLYGAIKIANSDFRSFLETNNVNIITSSYSVPWYTNRDFVNNLNKNAYIYLIITEDIEGMPYTDFYKANYKNEDLITNTFFDIIYGIYLMNSRLKLMHNDNHFGNIFIKLGLPSTTTQYQIDKIEYSRNKNYKLCFYDFDLSFLEGEENPHLDNAWVAQNKPSAKDIWTLLNSVVHGIKTNRTEVDYRDKQYFLNSIFDNALLDPDYWSVPGNSEPYKHLKYIGNIVSVILNHSIHNVETLENNYIDNINLGTFWNGYCVDNVQNPCVIPDEPSLYSLKVLYRFINDEHINKILGLIEVNPFYKKYIKYKTKYLELKKLQ